MTFQILAVRLDPPGVDSLGCWQSPTVPSDKPALCQLLFPSSAQHRDSCAGMPLNFLGKVKKNLCDLFEVHISNNPDN